MLRLIAVTSVVGGVALLVTAVSSLSTSEDQPVGPVVEVASHRTVSALQDKLRRTPSDAGAWTALGSAYVEQARITGDASYYEKARGALDSSLEHQPSGNGFALVGLGALANARHDFGAAREYAAQAQALLPDTAAVYGVLADALTQLGLGAEATAAVQRMLDLEPGVSSFTRAAYDLEQRGDAAGARAALERALDASAAAADVVFCRYHLGELAFDHGDLDEALRMYSELVQRRPLPELAHEYANMLRAAGRDPAPQFAVLERQFALAPDDLAASVVAADRGDAVAALRLAEAEWGRHQHVLVADALAWALHLNGRHEEALAFADRAVSGGWHNAVFLYHRGMILAALGRGEAAAVLDEALRTNPYLVDAPRAREALDGLR
jgi:tetratricopeptide (TPR) repeat protein